MSITASPKCRPHQKVLEFFWSRLCPAVAYLTFSLLILLAMACPSMAAETASVPDIGITEHNASCVLFPSQRDIWNTGIGEGFRSGTTVLGLSAGAAYGMLMLGSNERHHMALLSASYGRVIGNIIGKDKWYQGNLELRAELFGGAHLNSGVRAITGLAPHIRYHFATGTRFIPYIDAGVGVVLTEIRGEDLGGVFQFNEQVIIGVDYFIQDKMSINFAVQYLHVSSAGIYIPNDGVNTVGCFLGLNWFF